MKDLFTADFFTNNRQRLRQRVGEEKLIIMTANGLLQRTGDNTFPFQQDANFWYLTGIDHPDIILVIDANEEFLVVPDHEEIHKVFDGAIDNEALSERSGVSKVVSSKTGWKKIATLIKARSNVSVVEPPPAYIESMTFYTNPARAHLLMKLKEIKSSIEIEDIRPQLARLRMVKQLVEIAAIETAIDITMATLTEIMNSSQLPLYKYESELEADITRGFRVRGAVGHGFTPIVAGGKGACTLHKIDNNAELRAGELVVIDVGAEANHYLADITRTISTSGKYSSRQRAIYQAVADAQDFAYSLLKPGVLLKDYELEVARYMGEKLRELDLIKTNTMKSVRRYFPHATSHFLGLEPHDTGDYKSPLVSGVVITVEPGIYVPEEGIGVRIEDDVLITDSGINILSRSLSRDLS